MHLSAEWRKHWFFNLVQIAAILVSALWWFHLPVPGYAIAALAALAAVMTFHGEMKPWHKACWMLLIGVLLIIELRAIKNDKQQHDAEQARARVIEEDHFKEIADGLKETIKANGQQFTATMSAFGSVLNKTGDVLRNVTGGDSYGFVVPQGLSGPSMPLVVWNEGSYPLIGVTITIARTQDADWGIDFFKPIFLGTIGPHDHIPVPNTLLTPKPESKSGQDNYWIMISAQNGTVSQSLWLREHKQTKGAWAYSYLITRPTYEKKTIKGVVTNVTTMKPLLHRGWSDEVQAPH